MSIRQVVQSPVWSDGWLAALASSGCLAGLLWRLGDAAGTRGALWVAAITILALIATAAANSLVRHRPADGVE